MSRRYFSASAFLKKILNWKLNGTTAEIGWVTESVESRVDRVPALAKDAAKATIEYEYSVPILVRKPSG
jgi:hypothetical protein